MKAYDDKYSGLQYFGIFYVFEDWDMLWYPYQKDYIVIGPETLKGKIIGDK